MLRKNLGLVSRGLLQGRAAGLQRSLLRNNRRFFSNENRESWEEKVKLFVKENIVKYQDWKDENPKMNKFLIALLSVAAICVGADFLRERMEDVERFYWDLKSGRVRKVKIVSLQSQPWKLCANIEIDSGETYRIRVGSVQEILEGVEAVNREQETGIKVIQVIEQKNLDRIKSFLQFSTNILALYVVLNVLTMTFGGKSKKGGIMGGLDSFSKSTAKKFSKDMNLKVRFADVAGMDESKKEIEEFVDFLKNPKKYKSLGARIPRGALLSGPPGTGKTLLAKACAGEAGVPFYYVSGSEFVELFVGVGAARVRDLFADARSHSPSIVFIDEIDAVGKKRGEKLNSNSEQDSTLNQLLVELDGFNSKSTVVIFAATNRKDILDPALTRPGRIDRLIDVSLPDLDGRRDILKVHLRPLTLENDTAAERIAKRVASLTPGFSGAQLANVCNEAAIQAVRLGHDYVHSSDFELAVERVIAGVEKKRDASEEEVRTVAVHESGHGVAGWFLEGADPLLKLTIIPRSKGSLGFAQYLPSENSLDTVQNLLDKIVAILGGRVAEEEFFGQITTGAHDDLRKAQQLAHAIVEKLGMSPRIGNVVFGQNQYGIRNYSDETTQEIDEECAFIIEQCTDRCRKLIKEHRSKIENLSNELLQKKTIDLKDITRILGPRPFAPKPGFEAYLAETNASP